MNSKPPTPSDYGPDEVTLLGLVGEVLRRRRLLLYTPLILAAVAVGLGWWLSGYGAASTFTLRSDNADKSIAAGLASQFGISLASAGGEDSPDFYVALLESKQILGQVVLTEFRFPKTSGGRDTVSGNLIQLYRIPQGWQYRLHLKRRTPQQELIDAIGKLAAQLEASSDPISGVVSIEVTTPWPALSEQVNRRLLDLVNEFNLQTRQSSATAQRRFVEGRMKEAAQELQDAETTMASFLQENRTYRDSPRLSFLANELQHKVDLHQGVYTTLAQTYEQTRIDEVRDTPVITVIDQPEGSAASTFSLTLLLVLGLVGGGVVGVGLALASGYLSRLRGEQPEEYATVAELGRQAVAALSPVRLYRRVTSGRNGHSAG